ncbi:MAG: DinB family protein [Bryobacteraceae bacterium]
MESGLDRTFLVFSARKLGQLAARIEDCLGRLTAEQAWQRGGQNQNSIGNLVLHLCGNVRQWIIAGLGGAADIRQRDAEFAARQGASPQDLAARLAATVREASAVLEGLSQARLAERVSIQGYDVTVLEAVYSVVEHFAGHTGQVIFAAKLFTGEDLGYYAHLGRPVQGERIP